MTIEMIRFNLPAIESGKNFCCNILLRQFSNTAKAKEYGN
jgi:hypothetical protein